MSMATEWNSNIRRDILPGVSAHSLSLLETWSLGCCITSVAVAVSLWLWVDSLWALPFYVISAIALMVNRTADPMERSRTQKELRAGYTTLGDGPREVDQVDARSRHVIRLADETIRDDELRERMRLVRGGACRFID
jgi:hypothetical protein